jgi:threonine synthase
VRALFKKVETHGGFDLSGKPGSDGDEFKKVAQFGFVSGKSVHADRIATIRDVQAKYDVTIDTHTADGVKVAREYLTPGATMIVLETALPAKFNETIREALGRNAERPSGFENIEALPQRFEVMASDAAAVKGFIARHTGL